MMRVLRDAGAIIAAVVLTSVGGVGAASAANLVGGNGVYRVLVSDGAQFWKCGTWAASTRELHPLGAGQPLLGSVNGGFPVDSSYTTLYSHFSQVSYVTNGFCSPLCLAAGLPAIEPILNGATTVGYRLRWVIQDVVPGTDRFGSQIEFTQEVVVEGPVDGTETVDNSVIRETHIVKNLGPYRLRFGLRKLWDLLVEDDWGPWLGDCESPTAACDRSVNLTKFGLLTYPRNVLFNTAPREAACPGGVVPNATDGCGGRPPYVVAATVRPPTGLVPRPHPPEVLQFNSWETAATCWFPNTMKDDAECAADDANCFPPFDPNCGTALSYYYGITRDTAHYLLPGGSRGFTQYLAATVDSCPQIITNDEVLAPIPD